MAVIITSFAIAAFVFLVLAKITFKSNLEAQKYWLLVRTERRVKHKVIKRFYNRSQQCNLSETASVSSEEHD